MIEKAKRKPISPFLTGGKIEFVASYPLLHAIYRILELKTDGSPRLRTTVEKVQDGVYAFHVESVGYIAKRHREGSVSVVELRGMLEEVDDSSTYVKANLQIQWFSLIPIIVFTLALAIG